MTNNVSSRNNGETKMIVHIALNSVQYTPRLLFLQYLYWLKYSLNWEKIKEKMSVIQVDSLVHWLKQDGVCNWSFVMPHWASLHNITKSTLCTILSSLACALATLPRIGRGGVFLGICGWGVLSGSPNADLRLTSDEYCSVLVGMTQQVQTQLGLMAKK